MMDQDHLDACIQVVATGLSADDDAVFTAEMLKMPAQGTFRIELPSGMTITATRDGDFRMYAPTIVRPVELSEDVCGRLFLGEFHGVFLGLSPAEKANTMNQIVHANWDHAFAYSVRTPPVWYWIKDGQMAGNVCVRIT